MPNRSLSIAIGALVVAAAWSWWSASIRPQPETQPAPNSATPRHSEVRRPDSGNGGGVGSAAPRDGDLDRTPSAFQLLDQADSAQAAIAQLAPRAENGEVDALVALQDLLGTCFLAWDEGALPPLNDSTESGDLHRLREQAMQRRLTFCGERNAEIDRLTALTADFQERMEAAAAAGDDTALAHQLFLNRRALDSAGTAAALQIARSTSSPEAYSLALSALLESDDARVDRILGDVFTSRDLASDRATVIEMAVQWAECTRGVDDCGMYSRSADSDCIYFGECHAHLNRFDYIRTRALNDRQFEQMQALLRRIDSDLLTPGGR